MNSEIRNSIDHTQFHVGQRITYNEKEYKIAEITLDSYILYRERIDGSAETIEISKQDIPADV